MMATDIRRVGTLIRVQQGCRTVRQSIQVADGDLPIPDGDDSIIPKFPEHAVDVYGRYSKMVCQLTLCQRHCVNQRRGVDYTRGDQPTSEVQQKQGKAFISTALAQAN